MGAQYLSFSIALQIIFKILSAHPIILRQSSQKDCLQKIHPSLSYLTELLCFCKTLQDMTMVQVSLVFDCISVI